MTFNKKLKKMKLKKSNIRLINKVKKHMAYMLFPVSFIPIFNHSLQLPLSKPCRLIVTHS